MLPVKIKNLGKLNDEDMVIAVIISNYLCVYVMKSCDVGGGITPLILNLNTKVVPSLNTHSGRFTPVDKPPVHVE
jgi:hypothetical protein